MCFVFYKGLTFCIWVKLFVSLLCVCAILPGKAIPEMTYAVSGGTLNPTHSRAVSQFEHGANALPFYFLQF